MSARVRKPDLTRLTVGSGSTILQALQAIESGGEAITFVVDGGDRVIGCLTDGDIRRAILHGASLEDRVLPKVMRQDFTAVTAEDGRAEVLDLMRARQIERIPVLGTDGKLLGLHTMRQLVSSAERANRAVILAGGKGTRLHPITEQVPKPMVTVAGRPILERLILHLVSCGISRFSDLDQLPGAHDRGVLRRRRPIGMRDRVSPGDRAARHRRPLVAAAAAGAPGRGAQRRSHHPVRRRRPARLPRARRVRRHARDSAVHGRGAVRCGGGRGRPGCCRCGRSRASDR